MIPFFKAKSSPSISLAEQLEAKLATRKKKSILFVEDDTSLQELMQEMKNRLHVEIVPARTSGSAKALIQSRSFDLAILDVSILNGNGIMLYQWIQENYPRMSVIFLTGGSLDEISPKIHAIGSAPIYYKPTVNTLNFLTDLLRFCGAKPIL